MLFVGTLIYRPSMLYSSILSTPCSRQHLSESSPSPKTLTSQTPVNGAGNGIPEPKSGCLIGQIWQMSARHARCSSTVAMRFPVKATVNAIKPDSDVAHCASPKGDALIITAKPDLPCTLSTARQTCWMKQGSSCAYYIASSPWTQSSDPARLFQLALSLCYWSFYFPNVWLFQRVH